MSSECDLGGKHDEFLVEAIVMLAEKVTLSEMIFQSIVVKMILEEDALRLTQMTGLMNDGHMSKQFIIGIETAITEFAEWMTFDNAFRVIGIAVFEMLFEFVGSVEFLFGKEHFAGFDAQITIGETVKLAQMKSQFSIAFKHGHISMRTRC